MSFKGLVKWHLFSRDYVNDYKDGNVYSLGIDMEEYFDFRAFGEYMMEEYHGKFIDYGYVCVSDYGCGESFSDGDN
jgi:hypothetical protein